MAVNPAADDLDRELERFAQKLEAGAHFAMTQVLFEPATSWNGSSTGWTADRRCPLLVGVWPLTQPGAGRSAAQRGARHRVGDGVLGRLERAGVAPAGEGIAVAREMLDRRRELAAGAYLVPPFKEPEAVLELLA